VNKMVMDTSVLLAFLFNEKGASRVEALLNDGLGVISSVNYAELVSKLVEKGMPLTEVQQVIDSLELEFVAQNKEQAIITGELRTVSKEFGLSLGDRACIAMAKEAQLPVLTADQVWQKLDVDVAIETIR